MANRKLDLADYFTSRRERFIHQYRAPVFSDRRKNLTSLEAVSLVIPLHARDKSLFAEDVLRHLVRRLGNRHPIASAHPVLQASRDELLRHSPSGDTIGDPEEEQVERLAATRRLAPTVLRIQLAQDIEDRIELSAQPIYPIRQRRRGSSGLDVGYTEAFHFDGLSASRFLGAAPRCTSGSPITPRRYGSIPIRSLTAPLIRCLQPRSVSYTHLTLPT